MKKFLKVVLSSLGLLFVVFSLGFKGNAATKSSVQTYAYEFTSKVYSGNGSKTLGDRNWTVTATGGSGYWGNDGTKGQQFGSKNDPFKNIILVSDEEFTNISSITINASGASGTDSILSVKVGSQEIGTQELTDTATPYQFDVSNLTGDVMFEFNQTQKAVYIRSIEVMWSEGEQTPAVAESFIESNTKSSLKVVYDIDTQTATDVDLRFGSLMSASTYVEGAKYGVIVMPKGELSFTAGLQTVATAAEFVAANTSCHYLEATNIARVNAAGVEDEAGEYYQFAWVITNMEDHYQDNLVAVSYMEYEGKLYFNVSKEASVASVAETYVTEGIVADEVLVNVLKKLYE